MLVSQCRIAVGSGPCGPENSSVLVAWRLRAFRGPARDARMAAASAFPAQWGARIVARRQISISNPAHFQNPFESRCGPRENARTILTIGIFAWKNHCSDGMHRTLANCPLPSNFHMLHSIRSSLESGLAGGIAGTFGWVCTSTARLTISLTPDRASRLKTLPTATGLDARLVATAAALGTLGHVLSRLLDRGVPTDARARKARFDRPPQILWMTC